MFKRSFAISSDDDGELGAGIQGQGQGISPGLVGSAAGGTGFTGLMSHSGQCGATTPSGDHSPTATSGTPSLPQRHPSPTLGAHSTLSNIAVRAAAETYANARKRILFTCFLTFSIFFI